MRLLKKSGVRPSADDANVPAPEPSSSWVLTTLLPVGGSVLSGLLLALSFPASGYASLAFIGLVPLLFSVQSASWRKAAGLGLLAGFVFFMISLSWLSNLTGTVAGIGLKASALLGYALLALYCALYFMPAVIAASVCIRRWGMRSTVSNLRLMFAVTMIWVASEYARGFLFTGFPWNPLGVSQYANPVLIQIAGWGGVHSVTGLLVWVNMAVYVTFHQYIHGIRTKKYRPHFELMLGLLPVGVAVSYGLNIVMGLQIPQTSVQVALIQPNIPQTEKWDRAKDRQIRDTLATLTETAARVGGMDLIIWPETALPDFVRTSRPSQDLVGDMMQLGYPLLVGTMDVNYSESGRTYYNSSILFATNGLEVAKYNKQHLVPFGEYVPFPKLMSKFTPVDVDFAHGRESTLMPLGDKPPFSVLICFEDTVARLSVNAVRAGARWLVNQTNDAWFDPGSQSEQHLAHAVFRCVENGVPMARCCNTGVSCTIDAHGNISRNIRPRAAGFAMNHIEPRPDDHGLTFYTRHCDWFARFAMIASAVIIFVLRFSGRRRKAVDAST